MEILGVCIENFTIFVFSYATHMRLLYRIFVCFFVLLVSSAISRAQFVDGTKGLLCMPSAEFEEDATFMITNNWLRQPFLPKNETFGWTKHDSFDYAFSISLFDRLEIAYVCVLNKNKNVRPGVDLFNQDRHFAARVAITKDGEWGQKWLPAIAVGCSDPVTGSLEPGKDYTNINVGETGNGYFNRYYIVVSKNFNTSWGKVGGHVGYQYSFRVDGMPKGPQAAVTWEPVWLNKDGSFLSSFRATLEYDARFVNFGINASIWKDHFEFMAMLLNMQYPMVGLRFKLRLSH